jgi:hypothetical protein
MAAARKKVDGEAKKTKKQGLLLLFLCDNQYLVFLISTVGKLNCHVSFIGEKTGGKGG